MKDKIFAVYNALRVADSKPTVLANDFVMGVPADYNGPSSPKNTRLYMSPSATSPSVGRITLYYDRIDLVDITTLAITKGAAIMISDVLEQINDELGIELAVTDIVDAALPPAGPFTLTASAANLIYKGSCSVAYNP